MCYCKHHRAGNEVKDSEGGEKEVCELVENYARQVAEQATKATAKRFFENGASYEMVRSSITSLSDEELQEIYRPFCN